MPDTINRTSIPLTAPIGAPGKGQQLPGQARVAIDNVLEYDVDTFCKALNIPARHHAAGRYADRQWA